MQPLAQTPNPPAAPRRLSLLLGILGFVLLIGGIYSIWLGFGNLPWGLFAVVLALAGVIAGMYLLMVFLPVAFVARRDAASATVAASPEVVKLVGELAQAGFYKYADKWMVDELRGEAERNGYLYHQLTKRIYDANGEQLAERGVRQFVSALSDFLRGQGVKIAEFSESYGSGYSITVNGKDYVMYTAAEQGQSNGLGNLTVTRTLAMLNQLLAAANSSERTYLLQGDDHEWLIFLTTAMYKLIKDTPAIPADKKPEAVEAAVLQK